MTKEQLLVVRDRELDEVLRLKAELFSAQRRYQDAKRDLREADAGKRFGSLLTPEQMRETKRVAAEAMDKVNATQSRLAFANARLKKVNVRIAGMCAGSADATPFQTRDERRDERRKQRREEHETRMLQLLAAARGMVSMENAEMWLARLEGCVAELDYCDTRIEGVPVQMPWDGDDTGA